MQTEFEKKLFENIEKIYDISSVGGALHIVLDDDNLRNSDIMWCLQETIPMVENSEHRELYAETADMLLSINEYERAEMLDRY